MLSPQQTFCRCYIEYPKFFLGMTWVLQFSLFPNISNVGFSSWNDFFAQFGTCLSFTIEVIQIPRNFRRICRSYSKNIIGVYSNVIYSWVIFYRLYEVVCVSGKERNGKQRTFCYSIFLCPSILTIILFYHFF